MPAPEYRIGRLNGRFVVSWWEDGGRRRYRLDAPTRKAAEAEAADLIRRINAGKRDGCTVETLWNAYRKEKEGRRVAEAMVHEWKVIGPQFGHLRPDQVTVETCREHTEQRRAAGKHDGTIWTELGRLRTVFRWARGHGLIDRAPKVERPAKPAPKGRYLTRAEIARLLAVDCEHHIKLAIHLMLATAGRVGAILELTWGRVDFERRQIDLRVDAVGPRKGRAVVPMNAGLRAALDHAKKLALTDYVIEWNGQPVRSIRTGFMAAVRAAKLGNVTPHTLRHSAAVHLVAAGTPMERVAQYLGHSNVQTTRTVYGRFAPEHLQEEAEILDFTAIRERKAG